MPVRLSAFRVSVCLYVCVWKSYHGSRYLSAQLRALSQPLHYLNPVCASGRSFCDPLRLDFVINRRERQGLRRGTQRNGNNFPVAQHCVDHFYSGDAQAVGGSERSISGCSLSERQSNYLVHQFGLSSANLHLPSAGAAASLGIPPPRDNRINAMKINKRQTNQSVGVSFSSLAYSALAWR